MIKYIWMDFKIDTNLLCFGKYHKLVKIIMSSKHSKKSKSAMKNRLKEDGYNIIEINYVKDVLRGDESFMSQNDPISFYFNLILKDYGEKTYPGLSVFLMEIMMYDEIIRIKEQISSISNIDIIEDLLGEISDVQTLCHMREKDIFDLNDKINNSDE